jgi:hypothetical protein
MKKICWEESFHILHGRDVILAMVTGTPEQFELVQEALDRWWGPLMQFHGNPIPSDEDPMYLWRIKSQGNEEARQQFLDGYVPQISELGLTVPDPKLRKRDDGTWEYTEPDWDELMHVVTGHGPKTEERGAAFEHAGSVVAPDADFAETWAREQYGRRGESVALWLVPRDAIRDVEDWADEFDLKYRRVDGYSIKARLKEARERAGTAGPG